ncbi:MAG: hypothetical protein UY62_C0036G0002 [Parcubacteria group bacterium GW2011_GWF2_50_9]|nr:MAG: hypothetical protein UY62_C0036G0002 [Parcubacteria group bacterium GW2011_GWF2_50_9]
MKPYAETLKAGKERMRQLCVQAALTSTPATVRVVRIRRTLSGRAYGSGEIAAPRPVTRRALAIFLHECAHVALGHVFAPTLPHGGTGPAQAASEPRIRRKPRHVEEYEAEQWAFARMRESGIPIPRKSLRRAKSYVAYKIRQAQRRGAKAVDREAQRWAGSGTP